MRFAVTVAKVRPWAIVVRGIVIVAVFGVGYTVRVITSPSGGGRSRRGVKIITVADGTASQTIPASGTVEPATQRSAMFATSGTVATVAVTTGQSVTQGQTLSTLQTAPLAAAVAQAQAQLANAQAKLSEDEAAGVASATLTADRAAVNAANYSLSIAESNLSDATLKAPISGTVVSISLTPGLQVSGTVNAAGVAPAVTIISANSWIVNAAVSSANIAGVTDGEQAAINPQGSTTHVFGTVSSVGLVATVSGGVASFPITIAITGSPSGLYSGLPANVSVVTKVQANVIEIPMLAVHSLRSHPFVIVDSGSTRRNVAVTLGPTIGADVIVTHGLTAGERILERVPTFAKTLGTPNLGRGGIKRGSRGAGGIGAI